jgi:hypothetical protein
LLRGYGPVVLAFLGLLVMALLVPTVAPQQNVAVDTPGSAHTATTGTGTSSTPSAGASAASGQSGATTGSTVPGAANGQPASGATTGSTVPGDAAGSGATACSGRQVPADPYSPPCASFSGNNGGATSRGVTGSTITVTWLNPTDGSTTVDQEIAAVLGHYPPGVFPETWQDVEADLQDLVTYFNDHFQLYGRHIVLKIYNGQEASAGSNQSQVNADALTVADTDQAFAEVNAQSVAYQSALAAQHVLSIGDTYASESYYQSESPYAWGYAPDCTEIAQEMGAVAAQQLAPNPVAWGGTGVADGQKRRFAVIYPDESNYAQCGSYITSALTQAGDPATTTISYSGDSSEADQTTEGITQQIVNDKITTVLCLCDSVTQLLVSGDLDNANYLPEWFNGALISEETDVIAQQMDQSTWAHAALITNELGVPGKYGTTLAYAAVKSVDPNAFVVNEVDILYQQLYMLALGIQLAGPDLTPQSYAQGMWNYQGGDGMYGPWSFNVAGVHYFTPIHQFRYQWWDPDAISGYDGTKGTWVVDPTWYTISDIPKGPAPVFPDGPS